MIVDQEVFRKAEPALTSSLRPVPGECQQQWRQTGGFQSQIHTCSSGGTGRWGEHTALCCCFYAHTVRNSHHWSRHLHCEHIPVRASRIYKPIRQQRVCLCLQSASCSLVLTLTDDGSF